MNALKGGNVKAERGTTVGIFLRAPLLHYNMNLSCNLTYACEVKKMPK